MLKRPGQIAAQPAQLRPQRVQLAQLLALRRPRSCPQAVRFRDLDIAAIDRQLRRLKDELDRALVLAGALAVLGQDLRIEPALALQIGRRQVMSELAIRVGKQPVGRLAQQAVAEGIEVLVQAGRRTEDGRLLGRLDELGRDQDVQPALDRCGVGLVPEQGAQAGTHQGVVVRQQQAGAYLHQFSLSE